MTKVTYPNTSTVTYKFDANSNRVSMVDPTFSTYYTYDARNRLTNETKVISGTKYTTLYTYDKVGNILSIKYPDAFLLSLIPDAFNRVKRVGILATVTYTLDDRMKTITYGNGEVTTYSYDSRDRPTRILVKSGSTTRLDLNYTYGGTGNVLTINSESYSYDWLDRLASTTGPWGTITYTYDQVGNRVKMVQTSPSSTTSYSYGSFNRLSSTSNSPGGSTTFTYDANGNMLTKNGTSWAFTYDYDNRLTKAVHSGSTVLQSYYDGDGKRIAKTESHTFVIIYQGLNIIYALDATALVSGKYFYVNGMLVAKIIASIYGSATYYYHQDHLGSTRLVSDASIGTTFSTNYKPYGPFYGYSGSEEFTYTGKSQDSSTLFYYLGARFYDPTIGRFVTQDSDPGFKEDPQSFNRYVYARDNPLKIVDSNGHDWNIFGGLTNAFSAVSSAASTAAATLAAVASAVSNAVNSVPPVTLATTALVVAGAVAGTIACGGVCAPALIGAAIAATTYTFSAGSSATPAGVLAFAAVGALAGGLGTVVSTVAPIFATSTSGGVGLATGGTLGSLGPVLGVVGQTVSGIAASISGQLVNHALLGQPVAPAQQVVLQGGLSGGVGGILGDYYGTPQAHAMRGALVGAAASGGVDLAPYLIPNYPGLHDQVYYPREVHAE